LEIAKDDAFSKPIKKDPAQPETSVRKKKKKKKKKSSISPQFSPKPWLWWKWNHPANNNDSSAEL
jgi:hypothetical protein